MQEYLHGSLLLAADKEKDMQESSGTGCSGRKHAYPYSCDLNLTGYMLKY